MAVTVVNPFQNFLAANQQASAGLNALGQARRSRAQMDESKLSGAANRAYQEALGEQAEANTEVVQNRTRDLEALRKSMDPKLWNKLQQDALEAKGNTNKMMLSQIKTQEAQINLLTQGAKNAAQITALDRANILKENQIAREEEIKPFIAGMAKADAALKNFAVGAAQSKAKENTRAALLADFNDGAKGLDPLGYGVARKGFDSGLSVSEAVSAGIESQKEDRAELREEEKKSDIGKALATQKSLQRSPRDIKAEKKATGEDTFFRSEANRKVGKLPDTAFKITWDTTPGSNKNPKNWGGGSTKDLDYSEAKKLGLESEWLKGYKETFNESYDKKVEEKEAPQPPASVIKVRDEKYPGKEIIFRDGKWGIVQ